MRIRKRTPARAASPVLSPSPPRPLMQQHPKEVPRDEEDDEAEEILVAGPGGREDGRLVPVPVPPLPVEAASKKSSAATDPPEELWDARCNRNDGKRWRCKSAAVPGYLFCDRHVAWSARQRQPRARKRQMNKNSKDVLEPAAEEEEAEDKHVDDGSAGPQLVRRHDDGFYYYGGFQPGGRKRARGGGPGPVGSMNQT